MRLSFAAALFGAALVVAPSASAQGAQSLRTAVGTPFPYSIDLPRDWEIQRGNQKDGASTMHLLAAGSGDRSVVLITADVMEALDEPLLVSEGQARRIMTDMFISSDSLLYGMMHMFGGTVAEDEGPLLDVVKEIRILHGQRSAFMRGRTVKDGRSEWFEIHITVQNGILYMLLFTVKTNDYAAHEPLFARIRDSLVFAPAPK
jgi:hypothetical protein